MGVWLQNMVSGPLSYRDFRETGPWTSGLFPGLSSPGKCQNKIPGLSRFSRTRMNPEDSGASKEPKKPLPRMDLLVPLMYQMDDWSWSRSSQRRESASPTLTFPLGRILLLLPEHGKCRHSLDLSSNLPPHERLLKPGEHSLPFVCSHPDQGCGYQRDLFTIMWTLNTFPARSYKVKYVTKNNQHVRKWTFIWIARIIFIKSWLECWKPVESLLRTWEIIVKRHTTSMSFHRVCEMSS